MSDAIVEDSGNKDPWYKHGQFHCPEIKLIRNTNGVWELFWEGEKREVSNLKDFLGVIKIGNKKYKIKRIKEKI